MAGQKHSMLIVDDREDVRRGLARVLGLDFVVFKAATGEEGEALLREHQPEFLLCDYWLGSGQRPGTELIAVWRREYPFLQKVALMTGTKATAIMDKRGVDRVFIKPMDATEVKEWFLADDPSGVSA